MTEQENKVAKAIIDEVKMILSELPTPNVTKLEVDRESYNSFDTVSVSISLGGVKSLRIWLHQEKVQS